MKSVKSIRKAAFIPVVALIVGCSGTDGGFDLPNTEEVEVWFGGEIAASFDGNLLEIRGVMDRDYLRRGGQLWARSGPYFYLFNVHVQQLLLDYPDIAAVRAKAMTEDGEVLAVATLHRSKLNEIRWREALARASLAQTEGSERPQVVERLIRFGEDHTEFTYADAAS